MYVCLEEEEEGEEGEEEEEEEEEGVHIHNAYSDAGARPGRGERGRERDGTWRVGWGRCGVLRSPYHTARPTSLAPAHVGPSPILTPSLPPSLIHVAVYA